MIVCRYGLQAGSLARPWPPRGHLSPSWTHWHSWEWMGFYPACSLPLLRNLVPRQEPFAARHPLLAESLRMLSGLPCRRGWLWAAAVLRQKLDRGLTWRRHTLAISSQRLLEFRGRILVSSMLPRFSESTLAENRCHLSQDPVIQLHRKSADLNLWVSEGFWINRHLPKLCFDWLRSSPVNPSAWCLTLHCCSWTSLAWKIWSGSGPMDFKLRQLFRD